jgi:hypothetical protein
MIADISTIVAPQGVTLIYGQGPNLQSTVGAAIAASFADKGRTVLRVAENPGEASHLNYAIASWRKHTTVNLDIRPVPLDGDKRVEAVLNCLIAHAEGARQPVVQFDCSRDFPGWRPELLSMARDVFAVLQVPVVVVMTMGPVPSTFDTSLVTCAIRVREIFNPWGCRLEFIKPTELDDVILDANAAHDITLFSYPAVTKATLKGTYR